MRATCARGDTLCPSHNKRSHSGSCSRSAHRRQRASGEPRGVAGLQRGQRQVAQGGAVGQVQQLDSVGPQEQLLQPAPIAGKRRMCFHMPRKVKEERLRTRGVMLRRW